MLVDRVSEVHSHNRERLEGAVVAPRSRRSRGLVNGSTRFPADLTRQKVGSREDQGERPQRGESRQHRLYLTHDRARDDRVASVKEREGARVWNFSLESVAQAAFFLRTIRAIGVRML